MEFRQLAERLDICQQGIERAQHRVGRSVDRITADPVRQDLEVRADLFVAGPQRIQPRRMSRRGTRRGRGRTPLLPQRLGRAILDELVALRIRAFGEVADQMGNQDRAALIQGAHAFTAAQQRLSDKSTKQRAESHRTSDNA